MKPVILSIELNDAGNDNFWCLLWLVVVGALCYAGFKFGEVRMELFWRLSKKPGSIDLGGCRQIQT